jgi:putative transposase
VFFIIEHSSWRIVQVGVTRSPTDAWVAQRLREATPFGEGPRFLICDNDDMYGQEFAHVAAGPGIRLLHTPIAAPKANAICERLLGNIRQRRSKRQVAGVSALRWLGYATHSDKSLAGFGTK